MTLTRPRAAAGPRTGRRTGEGERQLGHRLDAVQQRRRRLLQPPPVRPLPEARWGFEGGEVGHPAAVFGLRCWRLAAEYDTVKKEFGAPIMEESR